MYLMLNIMLLCITNYNSILRDITATTNTTTSTGIPTNTSSHTRRSPPHFSFNFLSVMSDTLSVVVVLGRRFSSRKVGDTELERNTSFPMEGAEGDVEKVKLEFELIQET